MIKVTNAGELNMLDRVLDQALVLKLFQNDATVTDTIEADGTALVECDFTGYVAKDLDSTGWDAAATNGDGLAQKDYSEQISWDSSSTQDVYGYWVETDDGTASELIYLDKFTQVKSLENGFQFAFTPSLKLGSLDNECP